MVFDKDALDKAGADRADAFVAVTSGDNSNVVSATIARDIYRIPKVVARIFDPRRADIYRRLGIPTVSSVSWAANEILSLVLHQHLVRDVDARRRRGAAREDRRCRRASSGARSRTSRSPARCSSVAIVRAGQSFIPADGAAFHDGDILEVAVLTTAMPKFKRMLGL